MLKTIDCRNEGLWLATQQCQVTANTVNIIIIIFAVYKVCCTAADSESLSFVQLLLEGERIVLESEI